MIPESIVLAFTRQPRLRLRELHFLVTATFVSLLAASQTFFHIPSRNLVKRQTSKYHVRSEIAQKHVKAAGRPLIAYGFLAPNHRRPLPTPTPARRRPSHQHPEPRSPLQAEHTLPPRVRVDGLCLLKSACLDRPDFLCLEREVGRGREREKTEN